MTLSRDVFAAIAMHGLLARHGPGEFDFDVHSKDALRAADWAFQMGDAMIKFRDASTEEKTEMFKLADTLSNEQFLSELKKKQEREKNRKKRLIKKESK